MRNEGKTGWESHADLSLYFLQKYGSENEGVVEVVELKGLSLRGKCRRNPHRG